MINFELPPAVAMLLERLNQAGFEAFIVGGSIRDFLCGKKPEDYDITTNALPQQIKACFPEFAVLEVGIQHGTVGIRCGQSFYEITTYRTEGEYSDHRHPDSVAFTDSLTEDLRRRDFTMNAIAYHPTYGMIDPFGGEQDLQRKMLRAVGTAEQRFEEDALRILRGLRFASVFSFSIEICTAKAMNEQKKLLAHVSEERIWKELKRLLVGEQAAEILSRHVSIVGEILPELLPMLNFEQHHPYHHLDVFQHAMTAVQVVQPTLPLRLAALLHDCGKPFCFTEDERGTGHFYGHAHQSAEIAKQCMKRLKVEHKTSELVQQLIRHHGDVLEANEKQLKRKLNRFGTDFIQNLLALQRADVSAKHPSIQQERMLKLSQIEKKLHEILEEQACFSIRQLELDGYDVLRLGLSGKEVGNALEFMLEMVMEGKVENDHEKLVSFLCDNIDKVSKNRYDKSDNHEL